MSRSRALGCPVNLLVAVLLAALVAGCEVAGIAPVAPPGMRAWIIPVENDSARPAVLAVAEDNGRMGKPLGAANPSTVPPGARLDVTFFIPAGDRWAIFVNPGPQLGPLITAHDVPAGATGRLPLRISIQPDGNPSVRAPGEPGWFGN